MKVTELTVQMPREDAEFLESYAKEHATSVAEIFTRYVKRLRSTSRRAPHPDNVKFTGLVPADVDAKESYRKHVADKHGQFLDGLRRLGSVPAAPRDRRPVKPVSFAD